MAVSIEAITALIRYHPEGGYGDPYTFVATVSIDGDLAIIKGAMGQYTSKIRREIKEALQSIGVQRVEYERRNSGRTRRRGTSSTEENINTAVHGLLDDVVDERNDENPQGI